MTEQEGAKPPLTFEADFTRHIFSLFASLYDCRASPYIGPIPETEEPHGEEEESDLETFPPFDSSLCDFRLRNAYQNEIDSRPQVLDELTAKAEGIQSSAKSPDAPKEIILGERLAPRTVAGKTSEVELRRQRNEAMMRSLRAQEWRRERAAEERRKRAQRVVDVDRKERKEILKYVQDMRKADVEAKHERANERRSAMLKRRREMEERRNQETRQTEEARKMIMSIAFRSPVKDLNKTMGEIDQEQRDQAKKAREARLAAGEAAKQHNMTTKTVPREPPTQKFKLNI